MSDSIGNITVPEIAASGTFPIIPDYGHGLSQQPQVAIHRFGSANAKIEQRYFLGTGAKRFTVRKAYLTDADRIALRDFWELKYGPYGAFTYNAPNDSGVGTTAYTCRFANEPLSWEMLSDQISSAGVTLIEIPVTAPTYAVNSTLTRFPSAGLQTALLSQVQEIIPLVKIQPREVGYPAIYISDRRCTVGGQLYQARLLEFDGISQTIGNDADQAQFSFGNADRVMRDLAADVDLFRASLEFSLYHVGTGIKLDLWKGDIVDWAMDSGPEFAVTAADGIYELTLPYPTRKICRTCWKCFDDANGCPYTAVGALDLVNFPTAVAGSCDKSYDGPNGCLAHSGPAGVGIMKRYFGGVLAEPQAVRIKDNSTGVWGYGRSNITSASIVADSIYDQVIPEIYTDNAEPMADEAGSPINGMPVNCKIAAGRDESDFYEGMGIVGEGPLTFGSDHKIDGQLHHGYPGAGGLRTIPGNDPAGATDFFSLDSAGDSTGGDFRKVFSGGSTYKDNFAAGLAAAVIRRKDEKGLQLSRPTDHEMLAMITAGLSGWVWTAAGARTWETLTNPIWIVVNAMLRARGLRYANAATAELYFDVAAAVAAAAICDTAVTPLIAWRVWDTDHWDAVVTETQFKFRGVLQEEKPLRDWIQEILMNCLGYYTFAFGQLKLGVRINSSVVEAFTIGNILFGSLQAGPIRPAFNYLTAAFADREFNFAANTVTLYDIDHAKAIGGAAAPLFLKANLNLSGTYTKSQAARIVSVRLREELGGTTAAQWKAARQISFGTTVLALNTEPGMVCSMTHDDMPGGAGEFRVTGWRLNRDYSIEIQGRTTVDEMYDLTVGPKPADVVAADVPVETLALPGAPVGSTVVGGSGRFVADVGPPAVGGNTLCDLLIQWAEDNLFTVNADCFAGWGPNPHQESPLPGQTLYFRFAWRNASPLASNATVKAAILAKDPGNAHGWKPDTGWGPFCAAIGPISSGDAVPTDSVLPGAPVGSTLVAQDSKAAIDVGQPATGANTLCDILLQWADDQNFTINADCFAGWGSNPHQEGGEAEHTYWFRAAWRNQSGLPSNAATKAVLDAKDPTGAHGWGNATGWGPFSAALQVTTGSVNQAATLQYRNASVPTNDPNTFSARVIAGDPDATSSTVELYWSYTQGANKASQFALFITDGTAYSVHRVKALPGTQTHRMDLHRVKSNKTLNITIAAEFVAAGGVVARAAVAGWVINPSGNSGSTLIATQHGILDWAGGNVWFATDQYRNNIAPTNGVTVLPTIGVLTHSNGSWGIVLTNFSYTQGAYIATHLAILIRIPSGTVSLAADTIVHLVNVASIPSSFRVPVFIPTDSSFSVAVAAAALTSDGLYKFNGTFQQVSQSALADLSLTPPSGGDVIVNLGGTAHTHVTNLRATKQYGIARYTATVTVDWANGNVQSVALANGANSITFSNPEDGFRYVLILRQPGSGAAGTVSWPATIKWSGGAAPTLTTTNSRIDVIALVYDSYTSRYLASAVLNFVEP